MPLLIAPEGIEMMQAGKDIEQAQILLIAPVGIEIR